VTEAHPSFSFHLLLAFLGLYEWLHHLIFITVHIQHDRSTEDS
jgi:hypothetical protein